MRNVVCVLIKRIWLPVIGAMSLALLLACTPVPTEARQPTMTATAVSTETPTAAPTEAPTSAPSETLSPTATPAKEPVSTATASPTPSATPEPAPTRDLSEVYTVVDVAAGDVLNVRSGPGAASPIAGSIPPYGMGVRLTGQGVLVEGIAWWPVQYNGVAGWVNGDYLARQVGTIDEAAAARATEAIMALKERDLSALAQFIHPDKGVRFSPYAYVRASGPSEEQDRVFSAAQVAHLGEDPTVYRWGVYDGVGGPIDLVFVAYFARFVYDVDFARPEDVGFNETIGGGNTINNVAEVYPGAAIVEYHFSGFDPNVGGLDWKSLRLVLEQQGGTWYLVGIVHDQWTI